METTNMDTWRTQKRLPELENSLEIGTEISPVNGVQVKRFKTSLSDCDSLHSPIVHKNVRMAQQKSALFQNVLSPITEISSTLSITNLDTPAATEIGTPHKGVSVLHKNDKFHKFYDFKPEHDVYGLKDDVLPSKYSTDKLDLKENSNFEMEKREHLPGEYSNRRVKMNASAMHQMAVDDELSFYDDESSVPLQPQYSYTTSPQMFSLLSPEGSPQRLQIVEKTTSDSNSILPTIRQQKLQNSNNVTSMGTANSNTQQPKKLRIFHSLSTGSMESSMDDEYMELFEMESLEQHNIPAGLNFPSDLNSLISGDIKSCSPAKIPEMRRPSVRRCLSLNENYQQYQPKTPELLKEFNETVVLSNSPLCRASTDRTNNIIGLANCCFKRPDPPSATASPVQIKRSRGGEEKENFVNSYKQHTATNAQFQAVRPLLRKCMSMNDADIMTALARSDCKDEPDLIGDFSKPYALPLIDGRHADLKSVSSNTVARLISGEFDQLVANYKIIDCRYPYEYEGGHIRGAKNFYTKEQIIEEFLTQQTEHQLPTSTDGTGDYKRNIVVFHCEFSSERGPKLSRFLRNNDRARNTNSYPSLDYPEIYLLHNGYKDFYEAHPEMCEPNAYRPMLEPSYNEAYRHFRAKSKSWNGDVVSGTASRLKKSRSRLVL